MSGWRASHKAVIVTLILCGGCFAPPGSTQIDSSAASSADLPAELKSIPPKVQSPPEVPLSPAAIPTDEKPLPITFEDLDLKMESDTLFEDWMLTVRVKQKLDHRVRITGFLCGAVFQLSGITEIPLLREKECPYGPGGQAHHVIAVRMRKDHSLNFTVQPVTLEGLLTLAPFTGPNGKTWSLYQLADAIEISP